MSLSVCSKGHPEIRYEVEVCPVCGLFAVLCGFLESSSKLLAAAGGSPMVVGMVRLGMDSLAAKIKAQQGPTTQQPDGRDA